MTESLLDIFAHSAVAHVSALVAVFLFFLMAGLRSLKNQEPKGFLFFTLALFFFLIHLFYIANSPDDSSAADPFRDWSIWNWIVVLATPALIVLYLVLGAIHCVLFRFHRGLYRIFFGMTLLCYVYMVGGQWPVDARAILTLIWGVTWFNLELNQAS